MRWRLFIEEYSPDLKYITGKKNVVADALSRLAIDESPMEELYFKEEIMSDLYCYVQTKKQKQKAREEIFPLTYSEMGKAQSLDKKLPKCLIKNPKLYKLKSFYSAGKTFELICHNDQNIIAESLQLQVVNWYHNWLGHPGINRTEETICQHLWWPKVRDHITTIVNGCLSCQKNKKSHRKYGHLPEKEAGAQPWDRLCVDLIGPYKINQKVHKPLIC